MDLTTEQKNVLLEAVTDYICIYDNHPGMVKRIRAARGVVMAAQNTDCVDENVASLKIELAAALADLIEYRRVRYADSTSEEVRYRELTGREYGYD